MSDENDLESLGVDDAVAFADPGRARIPQDAKCIIDPKSEFQGNWDMVMIVCLLFTAIITPFEVAFITPSFDALWAINRLVDLLFMIDLVCQFFTPFYSNQMGGFVISHSKIAKHYLTGWFTIDFVSILPFDTIGMVSNSEEVSQLKFFRMVRLARLLKLLRVLKGSRIFKRWQSRIGMQHSTMTLLKYNVTVIMLCHWLACLWWIVMSIDDPHYEEAFAERWTGDQWIKTNVTESSLLTWASGYGLGVNEMWEQYLTCVYWSCMTVTTIGYGDVTPKTNLERAVAIFGMCVGAAAYAFIVGNICGIIATMDQASTEHNARMDDLNLYMQENRIPNEMRIRLREYFMYCRGMNRQEYYKELLEKMSPALRGEICVYINSTWINNVPFFSRRGKLAAKIGADEHKLFITAIAMKLAPQAFAPQEVIVQIGELAETMYIMQRGVVAKKGQIISSGKYFGEDIILQADRRAYMVRALTYVDVFTLTKTDLSLIMDSASYPNISKQLRRAALCESFRASFTRLAKIAAGFGGSMSRHLDAAHEALQEERGSLVNHQLDRPLTPAQQQQMMKAMMRPGSGNRLRSPSFQQSPENKEEVPSGHAIMPVEQHPNEITSPYTPMSSAAPTSRKGGVISKRGGRSGASSKPPRILEMLQNRHDELVTAIGTVSNRADKRADMLAERIEDVSSKKVLLLTIIIILLAGICIGLLFANSQKCAA
jgi:potassium voltage-gated channel Eag-related subfamily H protein 7